MFDSKTRTIVVVGAQWGDEGKGKLVDVLAERADWVVRYQGGANAGHTVHIGDKSFVLHQIPSGILHAGVRCAIGNGVVLDVETLFSEIDELVTDGIDVEGRLYVSDRAHLVLPYHKLVDKQSSASKEIGTTGRGIGPAYGTSTDAGEFVFSTCEIRNGSPSSSSVGWRTPTSSSRRRGPS
jgi:adenylosuccinate synthase